MSAREGLITAKDPFSGFPSVLALRDVHRRLKQTLPPHLNTRTVASLLALDPLALIRGLRVANSPIYNAEDEVVTVRHCIRTLGGVACASLIRIPARDGAGSQRIRALWIHAIATAKAAAQLAEANGRIEPEKAYVLGLLHDLHQWLTCLNTIEEGELHQISGIALMEAWRIPESIINPLRWFERDTEAEQPPDEIGRLLYAAEHMADIAGFAHPDLAEPENRLLDQLYADTREQAQYLPAKVRASLDNLGIDLDQVAQPPQPLPLSGKDRVPLGGPPITYDLGLACSALLEFTRGESLHTSVNALVTSCRKFLDFDRVYFIKWAGPGKEIHFRLGNDMTPGRSPKLTMIPSRWEMTFLGRLVGETTVALLNRPREAPSPLLDTIGSDQVIVAPVMSQGANHGFLIADRALRGIPLGDERLQDIRALTGTAALITENVLVHRVALRHGHAANNDPLTGIYNRRAGLNRLATMLEQSHLTGQGNAVIMLDVDRFKLINDTWGHQCGDEVLKSLAHILLSHFGDIGAVSRIGGEEFLIVIPGKRVQDILALVEMARQEIEATAFAGMEGKSGQVTASMGITGTRPTLDTVDQVIQRVDQALYASKQRGRNRFSVDMGMEE